MKRYKTINGLIRILGGEITERKAFIGALNAAVKNRKPTREQVILLKYIETRSTTQTARFMRESGARSPSGKSFSPPDVNDVILKGHPSLSPRLLKFAQDIFKRNKRNVMRHAG